MIDHLAILVIYLVPPGDEWLLDLHIERLRQHTRVPFTLYAVDNGLTPALRARLDALPQLRWVACPPPPPKTDETAFYYERLTQAALSARPSHLATLHIDSFPVVDGWAGRLAAQLSDGQPFLTVGGINTACLFFSRAFYEQARPAYAQPPAAAADARFQSFRAARGLHPHSGIGFIYEAWRRRLGWVELPDSAPPDNDYFCRVFQGTLFHLGGAARLHPVTARAAALAERLPGLPTVLAFLRRTVERLPPGWLKSKVQTITYRLSTVMQAARFQRARASLMRAPQTYLAARLGGRS